MAHSITQHPPSALPFPTAARTSSLGFGFGSPSRSPLANVAFGQWPQGVNASGSGSGNIGGNAGGSGNSIFGSSAFGSPVKPGQSHSFFRASTAHSPYASTSTASPRQPSSSHLKRTRRSSSPPPSPSFSTSPSPTITSAQSPFAKKPSLNLGNLDLSDGPHISGARRVKKLRQEGAERQSSGMHSSNNDQVDVGMMLASLPQNAYLPMILSMLKANPSLGSTVLEHMPLPELSLCLVELDKSMERFERDFGPPGRHPMSWNRCSERVSDFCRLATSYIHFFHSPPSSAAPSSSSIPDLQTLHSLLFSITRHITTLLRLAPTSIDSSSETTTAVSSLANLVLSKWSTWVGSLSDAVNQKCEMFPQPIVAVWDQNLIMLTSPSITSAHATAPTSTSGIGHDTAANSDADTPHVRAFANALMPSKERFVSEVGWLTGPRKWA